jgi:hypothetical protein
MSKHRLSSIKKHTPSTSSKKIKESRDPDLQVHRHLGVSLSGAKNDRTYVSVLEYYPQQKKIFLSHLHDQIVSEEETSSDEKLYQILAHTYQHVKAIAFDVPTSLPLCVTCELKCPGYEQCKEPHIKYMWKQLQLLRNENRQAKIFAPYIERSVEYHLQLNFPKTLNVEHALSSNLSPLTMRAHFLQKRLNQDVIEINSELSFFRIASQLKLPKRFLNTIRNSNEGYEARQAVLKSLSDNDIVFFYHQDLAKLIEHPNAFDSLIAAITCLLKTVDQVEEKPKWFPRKDTWISIPLLDFSWP